MKTALAFSVSTLHAFRSPACYVREQFIFGVLHLLYVLPLTSAHAQISINVTDFVYSQDFNTLTTVTSDNTPWINDGTLPEWYAAGINGAAGNSPTYFTEYRGNHGGSSSGFLYSYGSPASNDRALGAVNQNGVYEDIAYGVHFQNNSGSAIRSVNVTMRVEQWRRPNTSAKSHQRIKLCYAIGNPVPISAAWMLDSAQFVEMPEGYLVNDDTTTMAASSALDGNLPVNSHTVNVTFPVNIPAGHQFFLRFLDENATGTDVAFGVDDLNVTFSDDECDRITGTSSSTVFAYVDMGMTLDIPDVGSPHAYIVPSDANMTAWQSILTNFYQGNWDLVDGPASVYGYVLTQYSQEGTSNTYYTLRKVNSSPYFWGTYVKNVSPQNQTLVLQAPHPVNDDYTGRQAAAVWWLSDAEHLMIAGTGRCLAPNTLPSPCTGDTDTCNKNGPDEPYRQSDMAHAKQSIFHLATTVLAGLRPSAVFVQLHGFAQKASQPAHFYISCGTQNALVKSVPDYPVLIREILQNQVPLWDLQITHVDDNGTLGASDNTQGRFLNLHNPFNQYCEDSGEPVTVTNRFLHIEQYPEYRKAPTYYGQMATALGSVINDNSYVRQIRITDVDADYVQNFDLLPDGLNGNAFHTWGNNLHIPGVYSVRGVVGLFSNYLISDGSSGTAGLYSMGQAGSTDRALGSINDATTGKIAYGFLFRNDTGAPIYGVNLTYSAEQWRKVNGQTHNVKLSYSIDNTIDVTSNGLLNDLLFTNVPDGNMISTQSNGSGSVNGNNPTPLTNLSIPLVLNNGQELFIRFLDEDVAGTADVAMALDNLTVSFSATALPIIWREFDVEKSGRYAILTWIADNERDCDHYEIQRSLDGQLFETISTRSCQNLAGINQYEFRDAPPIRTSLVYYRVCQYDLDGAKTCSSVKAFKQKVRPEPSVTYTNGSLTLQTSQDAKPRSITIVDAMGRILAEGVPASEDHNQYRMDCVLPKNHLLIVRIKFDHGTYSTRIRTH